jgi:hypothetical protein
MLKQRKLENTNSKVLKIELFGRFISFKIYILGDFTSIFIYRGGTEHLLNNLVALEG